MYGPTLLVTASALPIGPTIVLTTATHMSIMAHANFPDRLYTDFHNDIFASFAHALILPYSIDKSSRNLESVKDCQV